MNYEIFLQSDSVDRLTIQDFEEVARATLSYLHTPDGDLSLVFTDDEGIRKLNKEFSGMNHATDVLSFSNGNTDMETGRWYYGDVVISIQAAERQAKQAGHSLRDELALLVIHGVLHILGFTHSEEEDRQKMWSIQDEILTHLGIKIQSPKETG